jgi:hypothetical protein
MRFGETALAKQRQKRQNENAKEECGKSAARQRGPSNFLYLETVVASLAAIQTDAEQIYDLISTTNVSPVLISNFVHRERFH